MSEGLSGKTPKMVPSATDPATAARVDDARVAGDQRVADAAANKAKPKPPTPDETQRYDEYMARMAGETWYLRDETRDTSSGITKYLVRCVPEGAPKSRDLLVTCSTEAGPNRCYLADPQHGFARLAQAAASNCSRLPETAPGH